MEGAGEREYRISGRVVGQLRHRLAERPESEESARLRYVNYVLTLVTPVTTACA